MLNKLLAIFLGVLIKVSAPSAFSQPLEIVAHRGGTADAPENTIYAIRQAIKNGADSIWITLQLSKDGKIVLYRPQNLNDLTNGIGLLSTHNYSELKKLDAAWKFSIDGLYPFKGKGLNIPLLEDVLLEFPKTKFYLDIKSPDADPKIFAHNLLSILNKTNSLNRTRVYSVVDAYLSALPTKINKFESRDFTRTVLAQISMAHACEIKKNNKIRWYGFELKREVQVVEKYTLGEARSNSFLFWDKEAVACFRTYGMANIILFGINNKEDYEKAKQLGVDGVMVNSVKQFREIIKSK